MNQIKFPKEVRSYKKLSLQIRTNEKQKRTNRNTFTVKENHAEEHKSRVDLTKRGKPTKQKVYRINLN